MLCKVNLQPYFAAVWRVVSEISVLCAHHWFLLQYFLSWTLSFTLYLLLSCFFCLSSCLPHPAVSLITSSASVFLSLFIIPPVPVSRALWSAASESTHGFSAVKLSRLPNHVQGLIKDLKWLIFFLLHVICRNHWNGSHTLKNFDFILQSRVTKQCNKERKSFSLSFSREASYCVVYNASRIINTL